MNVEKAPFNSVVRLEPRSSNLKNLPTKECWTEALILAINDAMVLDEGVFSYDPRPSVEKWEDLKNKEWAWCRGYILVCWNSIEPVDDASVRIFCVKIIRNTKCQICCPHFCDNQLHITNQAQIQILVPTTSNEVWNERIKEEPSIVWIKGFLVMHSLQCLSSIQTRYSIDCLSGEDSLLDDTCHHVKALNYDGIVSSYHSLKWLATYRKVLHRYYS